MGWQIEAPAEMVDPRRGEGDLSIIGWLDAGDQSQKWQFVRTAGQADRRDGRRHTPIGGARLLTRFNRVTTVKGGRGEWHTSGAAPYPRHPKCP